MAQLTWWAGALSVLLLLSLLPVVGAVTPVPRVATAAALIPPPISGTVVSCTSQSSCVYAFSTHHGTGWANSSITGRISFELPGESKISANLSYSAYTARTTSAYPNTTYWTVGTFLGTDVNSGNIIYGTTNTNYTATCHPVFRWCSNTYTTDDGTVVVHFTTAEVTSTSIACSPTSTQPGGKVSCMVNVTNGWNASKIPTGTVKVSDGSTGNLSDKGSCRLVKGNCNFVYHPADDTCGGVSLLATYPGTTTFYPSAALATVDVIVSGGC